jgi:exopolysaccharide biosynthesis polyprenyl glycosylphosphotransferase
MSQSTSTAAIAQLSSVRARRIRSLRAWMLTLPVDLLAFLAPIVVSQAYWKGMGVAALLSVALFTAGGLYHGRRHLSFLDDLPGLFGRMLVAVAAVGIVVSIRHESVDYLGGFPREAAVSIGAVLFGRMVTTTVVIVARRRRLVEHEAIIVGGGPVAIELARLLRRYPQYGLRVCGFVDVATHGGPDGQPLLGDLHDLEQLVRKVECEVVIIADVDCPETELLAAARAPGLAIDLWVVPRLREFHSHSGRPDHIGAIPVVRVRRPALTGPRWMVKRASDILFAATALIVLSPVLLLCALATLADGGGGVFFYQRRIGRLGKPFNLVKFRTMRPQDPAEADTTWSIADDRRVGPLGRFMRRTSLDELPQLWNILRGDMTVVGPRPEQPHFVDQFSAEHPGYAMRHRVPVGLTGLAQVSGLRGDTPISDRARFDNYYIENWSLWLDLKVLVRTVAEVFRGRGR